MAHTQAFLAGIERKHCELVDRNAPATSPWRIRFRIKPRSLDPEWANCFQDELNRRQLENALKYRPEVVGEQESYWQPYISKRVRSKFSRSLRKFFRREPLFIDVICPPAVTHLHEAKAEVNALVIAANVAMRRAGSTSIERRIARSKALKELGLAIEVAAREIAASKNTAVQPTRVSQPRVRESLGNS